MMSHARCGFSLIEMLVATAVLLVAVGVLSELAGVGRRHIRGAKDGAAAQRICQNLLNEILSGSMPLETITDVETPDDPEWTYSVEIKPLDQFRWEPGLAELRVAVAKASEESTPGRPFSLTRWIRYVSTEKSVTPPREGRNEAPALREGRPSSARPASGGRQP
jgi:prepilin-type N-terminal cleavage/methylation domain-containing protein